LNVNEVIATKIKETASLLQ